MVAQFVDVSGAQGVIDFRAYHAWATQWDGVSRVAMKATEGVGFTDPYFPSNRAKALAAGIDHIYYYHFARPDFGNAPQAEADYLRSVVGNVRNRDILVLDYEVDSPFATAEWAYQFLARLEQNYGGKLPALYSYDAYIRARLQDNRLARYPLWLAKWEYSPNEQPVCPPPWKTYRWLQYTNKATQIPGIAEVVDADISLEGGESMVNIPQGWHDDGTTLTAPNNVPVILGFRQFILEHQWDPSNLPLAREEGRDPLELSNPGLGKGTRQLFRLFPLEYTADRGVFVAWGGQEIAALEKENALLKQQLTAQQSDLVARLQQINTLSKL